MNEFVNKKDAIEFLEQEIKEISGRWIGSEISRRAIDISLKHLDLIPVEDKKTYAKINDAIKKGKKKEEYVLKTFTDEEQEAYANVNKYKKQEAALKNILDNMQSFEEFLQVATQLKSELEPPSTNSTGPIPINFSTQ